MAGRFRITLLIVAIAGLAGCHASCRHSPGPAFIERRPVGMLPAVARAMETADDTEPLSAIMRSHPSVGRLTGKGSLSIGTATRGFLYNGSELPLVGPNHRVMDEQAGRATNFGTDELVALIVKAAGDVEARFPGAMLPVGNLARGGGGPLKWSVSHKSGRDADMGFYLKDGDGRQVFQTCMTPVGKDGVTILPDGSTAVFDVARNWTLVKSILDNRRVSVQWLFMADHLKKRLLDYARGRREPESLLARADQAIAQPRGLIHDDHVHLRLYCSNDDLLEGCVDIGTNRPWYREPGPVVGRRGAELARLARSRDPAVRRDAVEVLGHFGNRTWIGVVGDRLLDDDIDVRRAAAGAVQWLGFGGVERQVAAAVRDPETPDDVVDDLLRLVERSLPDSRRNRVFGLLEGFDRTLNLDNGVFVVVSSVGARVSAAVGAIAAERVIDFPQPTKNVTLAPSGG